MKANYYEIKVPHLNANEDEVKIVEINFNDYEYININQNVCSIESSKITEEIICRGAYQNMPTIQSKMPKLTIG